LAKTGLMKSALFGIVVGLAAILPVSGLAAPARVHVINRILHDGKPVPSASSVTLALASGKVMRGVHVGETIIDGTRIDVPRHLIVIIVSSGGKSTTTMEPGSSVTFVSTGRGELAVVNRGKADFKVVPGSLAFFHVRYGYAFTASAGLDDYSKALRSDQQSLAIFRKLSDRSGEAGALMNIAADYDHERRYSESLSSLKSALALFRSLGDTASAAACARKIERLQMLLASPRASPTMLPSM
jgi:hypothetical protein